MPPPFRDRATGQKCPPAPMTSGVAIVSLTIQLAPSRERAKDVSAVPVFNRAPERARRNVSNSRRRMPQLTGRAHEVSSSRPPMRPVRNAVIGWSVRPPRRYSSGSTRHSSKTCGVTQPAQGLSRGNTALSRTRTSRPASRSFRAEVEPAGPPPTTTASAVSIGRVQRRARPGHAVHARAREGNLEELE